MTIFLRFWDMVGKLTGTIILTPIHYTVGNCAESIYLGLLKARSEQKKLVILYTYRLPGKLQFRSWTDIEFTNVESEYRLKLNKWVYIFLRVLITAYYAFFRIVSLMWRLLFGHHISTRYTMPIIGCGTLWQPEEPMSHFSWDIVMKYDWRGQIEKPIRVSLGKQKRMLAEDQRVRMGLPSDAWFVCLHVRESGFYQDDCSERNANIMNYIDAIEEVTRLGGWVIRMGDTTMTKLPTMEHVIDYPFTEFKNPLMDVYLISECRVYMGMTTGILDVAVLFQRPLITTNMTAWLYPGLLKRGDTCLFKHVYSKSRNRFLSIREWLAEPFDAQYFLTGGDDYIYF
jgi:putative glycosyltransferase (TIGR04372 family)